MCALTPIRVNGADRFYVGKNTEYFIDSTQRRQIKDIIPLTFLKGKSDILSLGIVRYDVWLRFAVTSQTEKELFLEVVAPQASVLEVYRVFNDSSVKIFAGNIVNPFTHRNVFVENWLLNLTIDNNENAIIYIKCHNNDAFRIPISVSSKNKFVENAELHYLFWGIYIGIMFFAFLYNFFVYLSVKSRSFLYYLLYVLISTLFMLKLEGLGFQFIWPNQPAFNLNSAFVFCILIITIILFTLRFLKITREQKIPFYFGVSLITLCIAIAIINLSNTSIGMVIPVQITSLLSAIFCTYAGIHSLRRKVHSSKYYLIAWSIFIVMNIIFILTMNNVIESNFFTMHCIFIGHMTEVLLFSFALADRINQLKRENENKKKEIINQLEENKLLQGQVNRELEEKVAHRTMELVAEKKEVERQKAEIELEKKRSDKLLLNILPEEVAEELKSKGSAEAKWIDNVTVLFTDFRDFTSISEKLTAKELVSEINECFSAFDYIMEKYGIEKIKTIGDSYMAAGGLPVPKDSHAVDVVRAALEIRKYMQEYRERKIAKGEFFFELRIGIHSGSLVAGIVGVKKYAYDIWGDTVNTASRIENGGEAGKINISGSTYAIIKNQFNCTYRGKLPVKGKGDIDMYFVEDEM